MRGGVDMGKHTQEPITSRSAVTGEAHELAYWYRMLLAAQADDRVLHVEMAYRQIDRLLDAKLALNPLSQSGAHHV